MLSIGRQEETITCTEVSLKEKPLGETDAYRCGRNAVGVLLRLVQLLPVRPCHQSLRNSITFQITAFPDA